MTHSLYDPIPTSSPAAGDQLRAEIAYYRYVLQGISRNVGATADYLRHEAYKALCSGINPFSVTEGK